MLKNNQNNSISTNSIQNREIKEESKIAAME